MKYNLTLKLLTLCAFVSLAGCSPPTAEEKAEASRETAKSASSPEAVATLPDGRVVNKIKITRAESTTPHYVYFIENATTTTNYNVPSGKSSYNQANIGLSSEVTPEQLIKMAEEVKAQMQKRDEEEYARLKEKLGKE